MDTPFDIPLAELRRRRSAKWTTFPGDVLPLPVAELDVRLAEPVTAALRAAVDRSDTGYAGDTGQLRTAFTAFAARRWSWQVDPAAVHTCADVAEGARAVLRLLVDPGDGVLIMPPVYPPFWSWLAAVGARPVEVPLTDIANGGRLDLAGIEAALADGVRVVLLCSPHNPTGRVHDADELQALADLVERRGATVIADEIHAPLTFAGAPFTPYLAVSPATGIALHSPSKAWNLAGLKCALIVAGAPEQQAVLDRLPVELPYGAGLFGLLASTAAYADGEPWLETLLRALVGNVALLDELLAEQLPGVAVHPPSASYLAWLDCRALGLGDDPAAAFLQQGRVALDSGPKFGPPGRGYARLNLGCSADVLREAVDRMATVAGHPR